MFLYDTFIGRFITYSQRFMRVSTDIGYCNSLDSRSVGDPLVALDYYLLFGRAVVSLTYSLYFHSQFNDLR